MTIALLGAIDVPEERKAPLAALAARLMERVA